MANSFRLGAVAVLLGAAAIFTSSQLRGEPVRLRKRETACSRPMAFSQPAIRLAMTPNGHRPIQVRRRRTGNVSTLAGRPVVCLAAQTSTRPGHCSAARHSYHGFDHCHAGRPAFHCRPATGRIADEKRRGQGDRFSLWTVSTPDELFTRNLTKNFIDPKKDDKQVKDACKALAKEYPGGDSDLKSALARPLTPSRPMRIGNWSSCTSATAKATRPDQRLGTLVAGQENGREKDRIFLRALGTRTGPEQSPRPGHQQRRHRHPRGADGRQGR